MVATRVLFWKFMNLNSKFLKKRKHINLLFFKWPSLRFIYGTFQNHQLSVNNRNNKLKHVSVQKS